MTEMKKENSSEPKEKKRSVYSVSRVILIVVLLGCLLWSFAQKNPKFQTFLERFTNAQSPAAVDLISVSGETMGTFWNVKAAKPAKEWNETALAENIQTILDRIDSQMSTYKPDSEVSRFNASGSTDWFGVSPETAQVAELALRVASETGGALDVTIAPLVNFWKFGPDKNKLEKFPSDEEIEAVRAKTGYNKLQVRLDPPSLKKESADLSVDFSAVAKGFAVDAVASFLQEELNKKRISGFMVDVGGETRCGGQKAAEPGAPKEARLWTLGIETPVKASAGITEETSSDASLQFDRIVRMNDGSIATSGDARNAFQIGGKRYSHILDPATGKPTELTGDTPVTGSVSVFLPECAEADAYATALYVLGPEKGIELADRLEIPVLYIIRNPAEAQEPFTEKASKAFKQILSEKL